MATYSDDFNRADSTSMGGSWVEDSGNWEVNTNAAEQGTAGGSYRKLRWNAAFDTGDYYSQADLTMRGGNGMGLFIRGATSATVTYYGYILFQSDFSYIVEITAGAEDILATGSAAGGAGTTYTACRISATGSAITCTRNGAADVSTTDATLTGGHAGLMSYGASGGTFAWDNWIAADLAAAATSFAFRAGPRGWAGLIVR